MTRALLLSLTVLSCTGKMLPPDALDAGSDAGSPAPACEDVCGGCCNSDGTCSTSACGLAGAACFTCGTGLTCTSGMCQRQGCGNCTDSSGACVQFISHTQCGRDGFACVDCSSQGATCGSDGLCHGGTCSGCRDALNFCHSGSERRYCGSSGNACAVCGTNEACIGGVCRAPATDAGTPTTGDGGTSSGGCANPLPLGTNASSAVLAPLSDGWAIAWAHQISGGRAISMGRLDPQGGLRSGSVKQLVNLGSNELSSLSLATTGQQLAVAWSSGPQQNAQQGRILVVDLAGNTIAGPGDLPNPTGKQNAVAVAWNPLDQQWGLVWREGVFGATPKLARYELGLAPVGTPLTLAGGLLAADPITWTGQSFAVVSFYGDVGAQLNLVDRQGMLTSTKILPSAKFPSSINVASNGTELAVAFYDDTRGGAFNNVHIRFARISLSGTTSNDMAISASPTELFGVSLGTVTWNGSEWAATWSDTVGGKNAVFRGLIDANGALVPNSRVQVSCSPGLDAYGSRVGFSGSQHAVLYRTFDGGTGDTRVQTF